MTEKVQYSEAGQEILEGFLAGQDVIQAAEAVIFDEFDRLASRLNLPMQEQYASSDQRRLAIEARWGEPHNTAWYIGMIASA
ncbi:MAG TPA: hypothetical protein VG992_03420 [Candidatus Saccharimonadales bacterium]|nr:hypothetical protein [Candidatus Saccharimonadales bacterium]